MNDDRLHLDPEVAEDRGLIDSLNIVSRISELPGGDEACSLHPERDNLIWAYADGFVTQEEEELVWEELSDCRYCLGRLAAVQQVLGEAEVRLLEERLETEPSSIGSSEFDTIPTSVLKSESVLDTAERILALFNFEWVGEVIQRVGRSMAKAELEFVPSLGPEEKTWRGQLTHKWSELGITIEVEARLGLEDQPYSLKTRVGLQNQDGQPVSQTQIDFCDIQGTVMETTVTNDQGQVSFFSEEGQRFISRGEKMEIGFCLELTRGNEKGSWQLLVHF